ncbi:MAG: hypothetical protein CMJ75_19145 [Planctomycetaceae bacterium]|nr:hypothetical protein [Planctomycetaceae bacterium]
MAIIVNVLQGETVLPAADVVRKCGMLLQDEKHVRWPVAELIDWINEAVRAIVNIRHAAGERRVVLSLESGARQTLPISCIQLMAIHCNNDQDDYPGRAITIASRSALDLTFPDWMAQPQKAEARQYMVDERAPNVFWIYPPAKAGTRVTASLAMTPDPITVDDPLPIGAEYEDSVINYVLYRCFAKDSEYANGSIAAAYFNTYAQSLGIKADAANATSPNRKPT